MKILTQKITSIALILFTAISMLLLTSCQKNNPVISARPDNTYDSTLVVATDDDYWPYVYYDENGNMTGHDIELITIVANELKMNLEIRSMTWGESLEAVRSGEADAVLTCEYTGKAVDDGIITTSPVKSDDFVVFSKKNITSVDELYQMRVGVMRGGNVLRSIEEHGLEDQCIYYGSNKASFEALAEGKCDCVIVRYIIGLGILDEMGSEGKGIDGYVSFSDSRSCIGVSENNRPLADKISSIVTKLRSNGTLEELNKKWIQAHYPEYTFRGFVERNLPFILGIAAVVIIVIVVIFLSQKRFYKKSIEIEKKYISELEETKEKAEAANQAKSTFLFNMSHDIRTPMNAIIGFTDIAEKNLDNKERLQDCLHKVKISGEHLLSLINDVLDMSRVESGKVVIDEHPGNLFTSIDNIMSINGGSAAAKNLTLDAVVDDSVVHQWIYFDHLRVTRIFTNIISNSIKYTEPGGKIVVNVSELPQDDPDYAVFRISVEDTGIGMTPEFLEQIFEPFVRAENFTKSGVPGTGLGMAITKSLVELMGGTINIESEPGKGTKVTVELRTRISKPVEYREQAHVAGQSRIAGKKVLLVEDNELNREIATEILEEEGMKVDTAEDGDVAVAIMSKAAPGQYDLILMDIQMPNMNGYDATRAIRKLPGDIGPNIPIVAMTANAFDEDKRNAAEAGMNGHISKPIDIQVLISTLSEIFDGK